MKWQSATYANSGITDTAWIFHKKCLAVWMSLGHVRCAIVMHIGDFVVLP